MAFDAGTLVATIRLDGKGKFDADLDDSGRNFTRTSDLARKAGQTVSAVLKGAALATGAATAASAAYVASLFRTGVAYNTLQQSSRAALSTLLGGAQQANAQMDKLDAFAKNSPFAKSVFITAQQQLLGFGLEARKVIPALSAIQDAVAAVGGSNEQISQITYALAQMRGQGKLTGETLNQLGQFGIDAATLIGKKMGKTGGEIRDMASKPGGIPVDQVWDPLVNALTERFGGAAANVKQTFTGTVDRIKAASRDIGAALAEPFVGKNSGGLFITWGNQVADVMRAVEGHVKPVVGILETRALPTFAAITSTLDKARVIVKSWDSSRLNQQLDAMGQYAPAIAAVGGAVAAVNLGFLQSIPVLGRFVPAISPVHAALVGIALASPDIRSAGKELLQAFQPLIPVGVSLAKVLAGDLNAVLPVVADGIKLVASVTRPLVDILASVPAPVLAGVAAMLLLRKGLQPLTPAIEAVQLGLKQLAERAAVQTALAGMEGNTTRLAGAFGVAAIQAQGLGASLKAAFISNPVGIALTVIAGAAGIFMAALSAAQQKTEAQAKATRELRATLDETTGSFTESSKAAILNADAYTKVQDSVAKARITGTAWANAVMNGGNALTIVNNRLRSYAVEQLNASDQAKRLSELSDVLGISSDILAGHLLGQEAATVQVNRAIAKNGDAYTEWAGRNRGWGVAMKAAMGESISMADALQSQRQATQDALDVQRALAEETSRNAATMSEAGRSTLRFDEALKIAHDTTRSAEERLRALRQAIDELKGGTISQAEAQTRLAETALNLADALVETDQSGQRVVGSFIRANGTIDDSTRAGLGLARQMLSAADGMNQAAMSAYEYAKNNGNLAGATKEAERAAVEYRDKLVETMKQAGLTDEQIQGLLATYTATPEVVATLVTDNGSSNEVRFAVMALTDRINAVPDKTITLDEPYSPGIMKQLADLGYQIVTLPDGRVTVSASGTDAVERSLSWLARDRRANIVVGYLSDGSKAVDMWQYRANGGFDVRGIPAFAGGGAFPTGIYAGRPGGILKFAEPETNWEAYISGKVGEEARNRRILEMAARRLGMMTIPLPQRSAAPASLPAGDGGLAVRGSGANLTVNVHNPVSRDPIADVRTGGELLLAAATVLGGE